MTSIDTLGRVRPVLTIVRPRMRGWLHTYAFFVAICAGIVLCSLTAALSRGGGRAALVSCVIYSVTVCGLLGTSALYHRRFWSPRWYRFMKWLDHSMIFVFIAGTYTPLCVLLLSNTKAVVILSIVWGGALIGAVVKLVGTEAPRWVSTLLYVALGWVAIAVFPDIADRGGLTPLALMLAGGVLYMVGAVFYALRRPNPWPETFGHHEFFHACTLLAATCHHIAIYFAVLA